jgi:ferredoxin--NADP+ reductase
MTILTAVAGDAVVVPEPVRAPGLADMETVTEVTHWTDSLFSFRVTRPRSLRFRSGEFVMIGLPVDGKPLLRAYSIASPSWDETLEFYSIKVADGPLTSRLQKIVPGDRVILRPKPVGTLVLDALRPGRRLYLFATGTGIAPFASLIRDPETYEKFDRVILAHTCRENADLAWGRDLVEQLPSDPLVGEMAGEKLIYFPTTTRERSLNEGRVTELMRTGAFFEALGLPRLDPGQDRAMICGSMGLNLELSALLQAAGLVEGANSRPGDFVVEKAFVG